MKTVTATFAIAKKEQSPVSASLANVLMYGVSEHLLEQGVDADQIVCVSYQVTVSDTDEGKE